MSPRLGDFVMLRLVGGAVRFVRAGDVRQVIRDDDENGSGRPSWVGVVVIDRTGNRELLEVADRADVVCARVAETERAMARSLFEGGAEQ